MEPLAAAELSPIDEQRAGRRALVALVVVVLALALTCVALMVIDWSPPRAPSAPASRMPAAGSAR
jgi:hypothetical protein